ncbi:Heme chaperone HemW (plasmid) [Pseudoseohaeicola sp. NH-UV-7]|uniref:radical SAM family heme chaperone HemW n=1 Tax=Sulfitobacter sp. TBRI5 TaxID=2989732 RepID=UPI003A63CAC4
MTEDWQQGGFGLYVHWPYCEAKCPYCDFNSHVSRNIDQKAWARAYQKELERIATELPGRVLNTIFFGGGTPSLMNPDTVAGIIETARKFWPTSNNLEVTLEANPGSVEAGRFTAFRDGGVNRISMGIQALNDLDLKRLGRIHTVADARAAFDIAHQTFERVSFDLIYARQDQTLTDWEQELTLALSMAVDHLSLYQLTIEDGTAFGDRYAVGKLRGLPDETLAADMFQITQDICEAHGLPAYEVSNHARPGSESLHNLIYWRYGDYAGIGPGAHGRITLGGQRLATESWSNPQKWLESVDRGTGEKTRDLISLEDQASEYLMMALRIRSGLDVDRYTALAGHPPDAESRSSLVHLGMIADTGSNISVTKQGLMVLNAVIRELLPT